MNILFYYIAFIHFVWLFLLPFLSFFASKNIYFCLSKKYLFSSSYLRGFWWFTSLLLLFLTYFSENDKVGVILTEKSFERNLNSKKMLWIIKTWKFCYFKIPKNNFQNCYQHLRTYSCLKYHFISSEIHFCTWNFRWWKFSRQNISTNNEILFSSSLVSQNVSCGIDFLFMVCWQ